jgi:integrase
MPKPCNGSSACSPRKRSLTKLQRVREHRKSQVVERLAEGETYVDKGFVFAGPRGKHLCDRALNGSHLKPILKRAGLPKEFRFYDLRHTCATLLLAANVNPKIVAERLGHASVTLMLSRRQPSPCCAAGLRQGWLDTYSHVLPTMQRAAADQLEAMLFG